METAARAQKAEVVSIQYLRALAALMVVTFHALTTVTIFENKLVASLTETLSAGVDIFFVISGFVMWYTTRGCGNTPSQFFLNRLIRIVPLYWLVTLLLMSVALIRPELLQRTVFDLPHGIASLFFLPWPRPLVPDEILPVVVTGWTLNYEMMFYAVFAFTLSMRTVPALIFLSATFAALLIVGWTASNPTIQSFYGNTIIIEFLFGVIIGVAVTEGFRLPKRVAVAMMITGVLLLALSTGWDGPRFLLWGVPAFAIVAGAVFYEKTAKIPSAVLFKHLGDASYSIYLLHGIVMAVAAKFIRTMGMEHADTAGAVFMIVAAIAVSCVIGLMSYRVVEKPSNRILKRLIGTRSRKASPP